MNNPQKLVQGKTKKNGNIIVLLWIEVTDITKLSKIAFVSTSTNKNKT